MRVTLGNNNCCGNYFVWFERTRSQRGPESPVQSSVFIPIVCLCGDTEVIAFMSADVWFIQGHSYMGSVHCSSLRREQKAVKRLMPFHDYTFIFLLF